MENIEIVIKIPEEDYRFLKESDGCRWSRAILEGIINGTPLPKGHGRLIDADALMYKQTHHGNYYTQFELIDRNDLSNAHTIIEADKVESEDKA